MTIAGPKEIVVHDVTFLTPAVIKATVDGQVHEDLAVQVDFINRKVYHGILDSQKLSDAVFAHLDSVNTLPENFFEAPEAIYNTADQVIHEDHGQFKEGLQDE